MPNPRCDRTWQVEAKLDGRLDEAASAALDVHARTCSACTDALTTPSNDAPDVDLTRGRARYADQALRRPTLRAVELEVVTDDEPFSRTPMIATTLAAVVTLGALAAQIVHRHPTDEFATRVRATPSARREDEMPASPSPIAAPVVRMTLREGHALVDVPRMSSDARTVLTLPDGDVELNGAQLEVVVEGAKTRTLRVIEGTVSLSFSKQHDTLQVGERWAPAGSAAPKSDALRTDSPHDR
jgi:anti-sigma factor RsiW